MVIAERGQAERVQIAAEHLVREAQVFPGDAEPVQVQLDPVLLSASQVPEHDLARGHASVDGVLGPVVLGVKRHVLFDHPTVDHVRMVGVHLVGHGGRDREDPLPVVGGVGRLLLADVVAPDERGLMHVADRDHVIVEEDRGLVPQPPRQAHGTHSCEPTAGDFLVRQGVDRELRVGGSIFVLLGLTDHNMDLGWQLPSTSLFQERGRPGPGVRDDKHRRHGVQVDGLQSVEHLQLVHQYSQPSFSATYRARPHEAVSMLRTSSSRDDLWRRTS